MNNLLVWVLGALTFFSFIAYFGFKYFNQYFRTKKSRFSARRIPTTSFDLYAQVENNPNEFRVVDISQSGVALHIESLPDNFRITHKTNLTFHNKNQNMTVDVPCEVVYVRNINHGVRMGLKFNYLMEGQLVDQIVSCETMAA